MIFCLTLLPNEQILDATDPLTRDPLMPFRMPIMDKYRDMGTIVMGKSEAGVVAVGDKLMLMPNKNVVKVRHSLYFRGKVSAVEGLLSSQHYV